MKIIYSNYMEFLSKNSSTSINFAKIHTQIENSVTHVSSDKFIELAVNNENIIAIITTNEILKKHKNKFGSRDIIISENPKKDFYNLYTYYLKKEAYNKNPSSISPNSHIHNLAFISNYNVVIEDNVTVYPGAVILEGVTIKKNSIIGPNTTIGYEGFEFAKIDGNNIPVQHNGKVYIAENVEIQANSVVDKGVYGETTYIGKNTKIDNHVHIGHNIKIGKNTLITANVVIGGSSVIGDNVFIGLGVSISNRIHIGNNAKINIGSTVVGNIKEGEMVSGYFAKEHNKYMQENFLLARIIRKHLKNQSKYKEKK